MRQVAERLLELGLVGISDAAHAAEHSLEAQLPFLQVVLEDFDILPIIVGFAASGARGAR